jgi:lipid-A-disaccharide synthase
LGHIGTPAIVAYKVDAVASRMRFLLKVRSVVLANLVADENIYPEFLQENATPEKMSAALTPLLTHGPERRLQVEALVRVRERIATGDKRPSALAADVVLDYATHARLRA